MTNRFITKPNKTLEEIGIINCQFGAQDDYPRRYDGIKNYKDQVAQLRTDFRMAEMQRWDERQQESIEFFKNDCDSRDVKPNKQPEEKPKKNILEALKFATISAFISMIICSIVLVMIKA